MEVISMSFGKTTPILAKGYKFARPKIEKMPWGSRDMSVTDPFGNRLTFTGAVSAEPIWGAYGNADANRISSLLTTIFG
jgi:hypothetical protein